MTISIDACMAKSGVCLSTSMGSSKIVDPIITVYIT